jgi:multiple sugar transport system permease protein
MTVLATRVVSGVRTRRISGKIAFGVILFGTFLPIIFPYYWMLASSLKTQLENITFPPSLVFTPTFNNYAQLLAENDTLGALVNSLIVGVASTALGLALGLPCAFAIARYRIRGLGVAMLVARMLPGIAMLVPWYLMFGELHLIGSYPALVFSHLSVTLPLVIWLSIGFFEELPAELMDAAAVDGCSPLRAFSHVALPLARAGVAASAVLAFVHSWNNFLYSLILGGSIKLAPVAAYDRIREFDPSWGELNAVAVVTTWPVILLSLPFTKHLVRGLTAGAVKG